MKKLIERLINSRECKMNLLCNGIKEDNLQVVLKLIPKVSMLPNFYSCIFLSVTLERNQIFCEFLQLPDIDWNVVNQSGETLLHQSLKCSDDFFLNELMKIGIRLDQKIYRTILHTAVATNRPNFVEPFLRCGAEMNNEDIMGMTPLDIAIENNNFEIVSMFLYYNCDTFPRNGNISPFMYSMICNSDEEMQLLLLEYETDMNNADLLMNNLFIAVENCEYIIPHLLKFGADVNQICKNKNILQFILEHPIRSNNFELIWTLFDYDTWESTVTESLLDAVLNNSCLYNDLWHKYLRIIIESPKIEAILNYNRPFHIRSLVEEYLKRGFMESEYYDLVCILLMNGCSVYALDLHKIYNMMGSTSITLKLLVQMDVENRLNIDYNFIRVRYTFETPVAELLKNFLFHMKIFDMTPSFKDILRYFTVPPKVKNYLLNPKFVPYPFEITWDSVVPSLLELTRNRAREVICKKYKVRTGSNYYSIVNHSGLPRVLKDILTFEKPLYFHKD